jgi:hypothetical protein
VILNSVHHIIFDSCKKAVVTSSQYFSAIFSDQNPDVSIQIVALSVLTCHFGGKSEKSVQRDHLYGLTHPNNTITKMRYSSLLSLFIIHHHIFNHHTLNHHICLSIVQIKMILRQNFLLSQY